ncbi:MAG: hypothetical protein NTW19_05880 [Planctomycetota bacterium]|nr:hypothetical protein [Planctomycetota bacterium]
MTDGIAPWAQGSAARWANAASAVVRSDMSQALPAEALSPRAKHGRWKLIPYETTDGLAGQMIWASPLTDAPPVKVPLDATGWHAVFVGLFSTSEAPSFAWIRLESEPAAVARSNDSTLGYGNIAELFYKVARLDGESLVIRQQYPAGARGCGVAYVKIIPLSPAEVEAFKADRRDASTRRVVATNDGFSTTFYHRPMTPEALLAQVAALRGTDFGTLVLHSFGADRVAYPSKHGYNAGLEMDDFPREGDRNYVDSVRAFAAQGINPTATLIQGAHDAGLKVHIGIRPAGWSFFEPYAEFWESPFYIAHPEWRCVDRDGTPVTRMSWAVPEVRKHLVDLVAEMVGLGADGAHLVFNRGFPLVLFEEPFVKMFRERFGEDPRGIDEADERITRLRSEIVTSFMRELRDAVDAEQRRRGDGKSLEISAMVLGTEADNLRYGLDLRRLVEASLLDEIHIYPYDFGAVEGGFDLAFFREICAARRVPFYPTLNTGYHTGRPLFEQALEFYAQGAAGVTVFDAEHLANEPNHEKWFTLSRMGHVEELKARLDVAGSEVTYKTFHRLGDQIRDSRYGPFWGG